MLVQNVCQRKASSIGQPEVKPNSGKVAETADHSISSLEKVMDLSGVIAFLDLQGFTRNLLNL